MPQTLLALAKAKFPDIEGHSAELELIQTTEKAQPLKLDTTGLYTSPTDNADQGPHKWGQEHDIRAELIRWLATDTEAASFLDFEGIHVTGARIVGYLQLHSAVVKVPMFFSDCRLGLVGIDNASFPEFILYHCWCTDLSANLVKVERNLSLNACFFEDTVSLSRAQLGTLYCSGTNCASYPASFARLAG
jgi:hypothetical protein